MKDTALLEPRAQEGNKTPKLAASLPAKGLEVRLRTYNNTTLCVRLTAWVLSSVWLSATPWTVARHALNFPGKNTGLSCHFLLQGIFPIQELNPHFLHLLHWKADSLPLSHLGSPLLWASVLHIRLCLWGLKVTKKRKFCGKHRHRACTENLQ